MEQKTKLETKKQKYSDKPRLLIITYKGVDGFEFGDYEGESEISLIKTPTTLDLRTSISDKIEQFSPEDVLLYISLSHKMYDMRAAMEIKSLSEKYGLDLSLLGCSCDSFPLDYASSLDAFFIRSDCSGKKKIGTLLTEFLSSKPDFSWKEKDAKKIIELRLQKEREEISDFLQSSYKQR